MAYWGNDPNKQFKAKADKIRKRFTPNGKKVVLLHGLFSSPKKFAEYEYKLRVRGYKVVTMKHNMPLNPADHLKVRKFLDKHKDADHFIGHSYGGMAIANHPGIPSRKIITLNSPFAKKGTNYTMNRDFLNIINPVSYMLSEHKLKGDHTTLPGLNRVMHENNMNNYNRIMSKYSGQMQFNRMSSDWKAYQNR